MAYRNVYDSLQNVRPKVSTGLIKEAVIEHSEITRIRMQHTGLIDERFLRGFWIEGPMGPPMTLTESEGLIVLVRGLSKEWRRVVLTKELMHAFDAPEEKANTKERLDQQARRFRAPNAQDSPCAFAESKAFWRAMGLLCPEQYRTEALKALEADRTTEAVVAAKFRIPVELVSAAMSADFSDIINVVMD